eukprot:TRINITY_DN43309_c0_g1_i1.p1 TRINITY_DN43309_c0_g1~~TRINITY_DN43309_c0_g1_i1.p1  ORF type:complete len:356 (+),score=76.07 TRINITY_DN43309_c0_g1_i1:60-1127(+)
MTLTLQSDSLLCPEWDRMGEDPADPSEYIRIAKQRMGHFRWRLREELEALRRQWIPILLCVLVLVYGTLVVFLNVAYYRYGKAYSPHNETSCFAKLESDETATLCVPRRLHDLGYDIVPELTDSQKDHLTNIPLNFLFVMTAVTVVMLVVPPRPQDPAAAIPKNPRTSTDGSFNKPLVVNAVRRVGTVYAVGHTIRACTYIATSVPGAADHCLRHEDISPPSAAEIFYKPASTEKNCGDLIFSGHMLITLLVCCTFHRYGAAALQLRRTGHMAVLAVMVVAAIAQSYMILGARHHYTVDVVAAWYVTPLLWHFYNSEMPADFEPNMFPLARKVLGRRASEYPETMPPEDEPVRAL